MNSGLMPLQHNSVHLIQRIFSYINSKHNGLSFEMEQSIPIEHIEGKKECPKIKSNKRLLVHSDCTYIVRRDEKRDVLSDEMTSKAILSPAITTDLPQNVPSSIHTASQTKDPKKK